MSNNEFSSLINRDNSEPRSFYEEYCRPILSEYLGVTLFVCVGCVSVVNGEATPVALAHGLTILLLVVVFGDISGGHFNPAVTLGVLITGGIRPLKALFYFIAQILGALCGAGLSRGILTSAVYKKIGGGAHDLAIGVTAGEGILCEVVLTTLLVLTVLMTAVDPKNKTPFAPIAIGLAVVVDILAGFAVTGASMNPARSFGPAVVISYSTSNYWTYHYIYWVGPILGSLVAGLWYRLFLASSENRLVLKD